MWSDWQDIERAKTEQRGRHGVYQIQIVSKDGIPCSIGRVNGVDGEGIVYIGKAGPSRSLATRIREFQSATGFKQVAHSGGETCNLMLMILGHSGYDLRYRVMWLEGKTKDKIDKEESRELADYFSKFGELPPCNSNFPGKWGTFIESWGLSTKP